MKRHLPIVTLIALAGGLAGGCASSQQQHVPQDYAQREATLAWDGDYVFDQIANGSDTAVLERIRFWCDYNAETVIPRLIELLRDPTPAPGGHGLMGEADMSSVAGRASWYLTSITGREFGAAGADPHAGDLVALQSEWDAWWKRYRRWWWD